jgi:NADH dehydrogenase (ubiquinone) 1 beta subcomplex subunit 8
MALRSTTTRLLNARLLAQRQPIITAAIRPQSTLTTGETLEDPQIGDYPNLPRMTTQVRGPYGWWDPQDKRNFGEDVI